MSRELRGKNSGNSDSKHFREQDRKIEEHHQRLFDKWKKELEEKLREIKTQAEFELLFQTLLEEQIRLISQGLPSIADNEIPEVVIETPFSVNYAKLAQLKAKFGVAIAMIIGAMMSAATLQIVTDNSHQIRENLTRMADKAVDIAIRTAPIAAATTLTTMSLSAGKAATVLTAYILTNAPKAEAKKQKPLKVREDEEFISFCNACLAGDFNKIESILSLKQSKNSLTSLLTSVDKKYGVTPLQLAIMYSDKFIVKAILDHAKKFPNLLRRILLQRINKSHSILHRVVIMRDDLLETILNAIADQPNLIEEVLMQENEQEQYPVYLAAFSGKNDVVRIIFNFARNYEGLLQKITIRQNINLNNIAIINLLLISGNNEAIDCLIESVPNIKIASTPTRLLCNIPQTTIYYLHFFLAKSDQEATYLRRTAQGKLEDFRIYDFTSSSTAPILVKLKKKKNPNPKYVIIGSDLVDVLNDQSTQALKEAFELANCEPKSNQIITTLSVYSNRNNNVGHSITVEFSRRISDDTWKVIIYDPNKSNSDIKQGYSDALSKILNPISKNFRFDLKMTFSEIIVQNSKEGHCDALSSLVGGAIATDCKGILEKECAANNENCAETSLLEPHKEMDRVLTKRLARIKKGKRQENPENYKIPPEFFKPNGYEQVDKGHDHGNNRDEL